MEILKLWENEDEDKRVLVKKGENHFLIQEYTIGGTFYKNWYVYEDYNNDIDFLISEDTSEFDLMSKGNYKTLFDALKDIEENDEEYRGEF